MPKITLNTLVSIIYTDHQAIYPQEQDVQMTTDPPKGGANQSHTGEMVKCSPGPKMGMLPNPPEQSKGQTHTFCLFPTIPTAARKPATHHM